MRNKGKLRILLIEDNPGDTRLILEMLRLCPNISYELINADSLKSAFLFLAEQSFDIILLDLGLPESQGINTLHTVLQHQISLPIVVITSFDDDNAGLSAVQIGAQDYLIKGQIDSSLLIRTIRYAIERFQIKEALSNSEMKYRSLIDQANDAIFLTDLESELFIDANHKAQELIGSSGEEIQKMHLYDLFPSDNKEIFSVILNSLQSGEHGVVIEGCIRHHTGECIPMEINSSILEIDNKRCILSIFRDISERKHAENALMHAQKKLNLLNNITFKDIQNSVFTLTAYLEMLEDEDLNPFMKDAIIKVHTLATDLQNSIDYAKDFQNMGINAPEWQNVLKIYQFAISHLDLSGINQNISLDNLEIFCDPLLEKVLFILIENVVRHGQTATEIVFRYDETEHGIILTFEDNGVGVLDEEKEYIFERGYGEKKGLDMFLAREILSITGISISESGIYGNGARFLLSIPKGGYRFSPVDDHINR